MPRRVTLAVLAAGLLAVAGTAAGDPGDEKLRVDGRIEDLRDRIAGAREQEGVLTHEISSATARIRTLEEQVDVEQVELAVLETRLSSARDRLDRLGEQLTRETDRLNKLNAQHARAVRRLETRVRDLYMTETPDLLSFVLDVSSFSDLLDNVELLSDIGRQDKRIARAVEHARDETERLRERTIRTRADQAVLTRAIAERHAEERAVRDRLVANREALSSARAAKSDALAGVRDDEADFIAEVEALEQESARLAAVIQAAQSRSTGSGVSASGLMWPVSGPVTSGFGWRWGRMHEGIDIAVPTGTPVVAVAGGTVIHAGWLGGYGNLVVVDHGNGLATAYAHNSAYASGVGQTVSQGQVVAYSGNTGNSSGPHVHFEVRVNGSAVDPFGYL